MNRTTQALFLACTLAFGQLASAQEPVAAAASAPAPTARARNAARRAYTRAQRDFDAGRFAEAERGFTEAFELVPNPVVLVGLATARQSQGNVAGAIEALRTYLQASPDAPDRADMEARLQGLEQTPGTLAWTVAPTDSSVNIDGTVAAPGLAEQSIPPGAHTVLVEHEGYESQSVAVQVAPASRASVQVELAALPPAPAPEPVVVAPDEEPSLGDDTQTEPEPEPASSGPSAAVWATAGVAVASAIGGTVLGFMALSKEADFDATPTAEIADQGERFALFSDVLFGVAAATAITSVVLFLAGEEDAADSEAEEFSVAPSVSPSGAHISARLRF